MTDIVRRDSAGVSGAIAVPGRQPYLMPEDIFTVPTNGAPVFWTCVRTRPRWEKKFAKWLIRQQKSFFLPVMAHETISGRKRRIAELPLFPGFVFLQGNHDKRDLDRAGNVVYVLKPDFTHQIEQLHQELRNVWLGLTSGLYVSPIHNLACGELCRIVRGPLQGVTARFERAARAGRLILQVEMMGGGLSIDVNRDEVEVLA